eukprot:8793310-Pyramimonas_sp.AAC.1
MGSSSQEGAARLVLLGFPRPLMQATLRRAAEVARRRRVPLHSHNSVVIKAFDPNRKAIFEFNSASAASDFPSNFQNIEGELQFPDPKGGHFVLKARRDLKVKDRRLFLAMGKLRQKLEALLNGRFTVGSNGLGGDVYILRGEEDPVQCAHVSVLEGVNDVQVEFTDSTLTEFGILADKGSLM